MASSALDELWLQLAERPFDRALRLVLADALLEAGDSQGEAIALAARPHLELSERRHLARLTELQAPQWFKNIKEIIEMPFSRIEGGFISHLSCVMPREPSAYARLAGARELCTVTSLALPTTREPPAVEQFLMHPMLKHLTRLQAPASVWAALAGVETPFALETVALAGWGTFEGELEPLVRSLDGAIAKRIDLSTTEFVNPFVVQDVWRTIAAAPAMLAQTREVRLIARFGIIEGAVAWLLAGATGALERTWPLGDAWSIEYGELLLSLQRAGGEAFSSLMVDLAHGGDVVGLGQRIASAASVLVQLAPARLEAIEVRLPAGARLRPAERDALRAAARRLGSVKAFSLGGASVSP